MKSNAVLAGLGAVILLAACGGGGEEAKEKKIEAEAAKHGVDADVELDDKGEVESVTIKNALGDATVGKNVSLPDEFPDDVSVDDDWTVNAVSAVQDGYMVSAMAEDASMDDVAASVRSALSAKGWTEEAGGVAMAQMTQLKFEKDGRLSSYTLMDAGKGSISVQLVTMKMPG